MLSCPVPFSVAHRRSGMPPARDHAQRRDVARTIAADLGAAHVIAPRATTWRRPEYAVPFARALMVPQHLRPKIRVVPHVVQGERASRNIRHHGAKHRCVGARLAVVIAGPPPPCGAIRLVAVHPDLPPRAPIGQSYTPLPRGATNVQASRDCSAMRASLNPAARA